MELAELTSKLFDKETVRFYGDPNHPMFVAAEIGKILKIKQITASIIEFEENEKDKKIIPTPGGPQEMVMLTMKGIYRIAFTSRSAIAKRFRNWVYDVLEEIRLTGQYIPAPAMAQPQVIPDTENQLALMSKNYENIRQMMERIEKDRERERQEHKMAEIKYQKEIEYLKNKIEKNKQEIVYVVRMRQSDVDLFKIGQTDNEKHRLATFDTGSPEYVELCFKVDCGDVPGAAQKYESTIHFILRDFRINPNKEFFKCDLDLIKEVCIYVKKFYEESFTITHEYKIKKQREIQMKMIKEDPTPTLKELPLVYEDIDPEDALELWMDNKWHTTVDYFFKRCSKCSKVRQKKLFDEDETSVDKMASVCNPCLTI